MTIYQAHQQLRDALTPLYDPREAVAIANLVVEHLTGKKKTDRLLHPATLLTAEQQALWQSYSGQLVQYRPVQYVLGEAWFAGMKFYVNEHVLIPRPETEELVAWVTDHAGSSAGQILDIGTGSGCIPITIKKKLPYSNITSIDISPEALCVAAQNATIFQTSINLQELDFLNEKQWHILGQYDLIVSNPPYIKISESTEMKKNVLDHEPSLALFVPDDDPLIFYRKIAAFAADHLAGNGSIFMEINETLGNEVRLLFETQQYKVELKKDLQGKERMIKASLY
jgi:release factor glutamine methyltransferase